MREREGRVREGEGRVGRGLRWREREGLGEKRGVGFAEKREAEVAEHAIGVGLGYSLARSLCEKERFKWDGNRFGWGECSLVLIVLLVLLIC